ncbi:MAG: DUF6265 family protein [Thermoanaerobaculia bacterium]|nr:DUF6265 family protein [Thermoanaerobaculia bacterium]
MKKLTLLALVACLFSGVRVSAQALDFFVGAWRGGEGEIVIEEIWSQSRHGQMIGMFRMMKGDEPKFYELMSIEWEGGDQVMYLRHFDPGLEAWEDKTDALVFDLVSAESNRAVFDQRGADTNLVYELGSDGALTVTLEKLHDGEWRKTRFVYQRMDG